jgi:integrase
MGLRFSRLDRLSIRRLKPGESISEHGITAAKLSDGDVRYIVGIMVDGKRVHRVIGKQSNGVTRTKCEEFIAAAQTDARAGRLSLPRGRKLALSFAAAADLYLKKLKEINGRDLKNNDQHIRLHLKPYFGAMNTDQISTFTLQKFQNDCDRKGIKESTSNRILATYRRMGRKLFKWKMIATPFPMIELCKERNERQYVISEAEERRLLAAALADGSPYIWLFIKFGLSTSLRHSELLRARFENFDPERRRLLIQVKGGRWRRQPLPQSITDILVKERQMAQDPQGWIFPSARSTTGHVVSMRAAFSRCVVAAGMNPTVVVPHIMRHTAVSRLAAIGADIKTIQEFSGHESLAMVMRYAHAQDRAVDAALDRLDARTAEEHPPARTRQNR